MRLLLIILMILQGARAVAEDSVQVMLSPEWSFPPYLWVDAEGHYHGVTVILLEKLMADLGERPSWHDVSDLDKRLDITLVSRNWGRRDNGLIYIKQPLLSLELAAFSRAADAALFQRLEDFRGRKVALSMIDEVAMRESPAYDELVAVGAIPIWRADLDEAMRDVDSGALDAVIYIRHLASIYLRGSGLKERVVELSVSVEKFNDVLVAVGKEGRLSQRADEVEHLLRGYHRSGYDQFVLRQGMVEYMGGRRKQQGARNQP